MAVTSAARATDMDTGRAVTGFYFHRFLCRIFSKPNSPFLLKGGQSVLARTSNARATRDIDLLAESGDLAAAIEEIKVLAAMDLGDFLTFEFAGAEPIKVSDEYRVGARLTFIPILGRRRLQRILIDLVVDQIPCAEPELVTPADRITVEGIPVFDYRVYPLVNSIADKLCAILETHNGRPSSRVKDLVDLLVYATTEDADGSELCKWCCLEARVRGIALPTAFSVPNSWHDSYEAEFRKLATEAHLPEKLRGLDEAERFAANYLDPVLNGDTRNMRWNHRASSWE